MSTMQAPTGAPRSNVLHGMGQVGMTLLVCVLVVVVLWMNQKLSAMGDELDKGQADRTRIEQRTDQNAVAIEESRTTVTVLVQQLLTLSCEGIRLAGGNDQGICSSVPKPPTEGITP